MVDRTAQTGTYTGTQSQTGTYTGTQSQTGSTGSTTTTNTGATTGSFGSTSSGGCTADEKPEECLVWVKAGFCNQAGYEAYMKRVCCKSCARGL